MIPTPEAEILVVDDSATANESVSSRRPTVAKLFKVEDGVNPNRVVVGLAPVDTNAESALVTYAPNEYLITIAIVAPLTFWKRPKRSPMDKKSPPSVCNVGNPFIPVGTNNGCAAAVPCVAFLLLPDLSRH